MILFKDLLDRYSLNFAETGDHASRAVSALIAVDVQGMISRIQYENHGLNDGGESCVDFAVFVCGDVDFQLVDVVFEQPLLEAW